LQLWRQT
jgi:aryl-alcohol dehydrogenase-like predicted oxidoreductase